LARKQYIESKSNLCWRLLREVSWAQYTFQNESKLKPEGRTTCPVEESYKHPKVMKASSEDKKKGWVNFYISLFRFGKSLLFPS
jgi:GH25 family lysozyme M1 (1,4-beta-N-acetylmuramidase)